jgi:non-ribosomal peptide synthetase component F
LRARAFWSAQQFVEPTSLAVHTAIDARQPARRASISVAPHVPAGLRTCAARFDLPVEHLLLGAIVLYVARATSSTTLMLGIRTHGRSQEARDAIGCFANVVPLCVSINSHQTAEACFRAIKVQWDEACTHGRFRLQDIDRLRGASAGTLAPPRIILAISMRRSDACIRSSRRMDLN